ncbi:CHAT domain-containing protein [Streptomyces tendae]|uniref:CHAT domain-containing protein n=1 Tax=Streptomyces tendae TaxID=1932 RepID=UPI003EB833EB
MTHDPVVEVLQDPAHGFTGVPRQRGSAAELRVRLYRTGTDLRMLAIPRGISASDSAEWHEALLEVPAEELLDRANRLLAIWRDQVVGRIDTGGGDGGQVGGFPMADSVDLTELRALTDPLVAKLADEGFELLQVLLDGTSYDLGRFREFLLEALAGGQQLRISFDSEWQLPWSMLAVDPAECDSPWEAFLGHRHQIEQARTGYPWDHAPLGRRERATVSLNKDIFLDHVNRSHEVQKLLEERSLLTVRTRGSELLEALARSVLTEDLMYFWCHGRFVSTGASGQVLTVRLSDSEDIDGPVVKRQRRRYIRSPQSRFKPFVLLNACHSARGAAPGRLKHLGQELIDQGADGVLAPQIEIPEDFAAEYAYAFLDRYLTGDDTAGAIGQALVRRFAREFHNPLALVYSLNSGMNTRLDLVS